MKWPRLLLSPVLALALATPVSAGVPAPPPEPLVLNHSEEPGSVLVFHKFIAGTLPTPDGRSEQPATELEISATCPRDFACADHQPVRLRAHWVCPGDQHTACAESAFELVTSVKGTVAFTPADVGHPPCHEGYLIVWVVSDDHDALPIKFDALIGSAVIRHSPSSAGAYNALPIQAAAHLATGDYTDANGNADGKLDFDSTEYKAITGKIFGTVRYEQTGVETSLTLLTLDVLSNEVNEATVVDLNFYNEHEELRPASTSFHCWAQTRLTAIDHGLTAAFGLKGLVESTAAHQGGVPVTVVGIVSTVQSFVVPVTSPILSCQATCDAACGVITPNCATLCPVLLPGIPNPCLTGCNAAVARTRCEARCGITACNAVAGTVHVPSLQEYSYSLFNDGVATATTFAPSPGPPPDGH